MVSIFVKEKSKFSWDPTRSIQRENKELLYGVPLFFLTHFFMFMDFPSICSSSDIVFLGTQVSMMYLLKYVYQYQKLAVFNPDNIHDYTRSNMVQQLNASLKKWRPRKHFIHLVFIGLFFISVWTTILVKISGQK